MYKRSMVGVINSKAMVTGLTSRGAEQERDHCKSARRDRWRSNDPSDDEQFTGVGCNL